VGGASSSSNSSNNNSSNSSDSSDSDKEENEGNEPEEKERKLTIKYQGAPHANKPIGVKPNVLKIKGNVGNMMGVKAKLDVKKN
jgi:hypothetical protein